MTSHTDIDAIVEGLSEAQKRAVLSLYASGKPRDSHERGMGGSLAAIRRLGLAEPGWHWDYRSRPWSLTPLGLSVRSALLEARER